MSVKIILVVVSLILSLAIGLTVAGISGTSAGGGGGNGRGAADESRPVVIGLSLDTLKEERWQTDRDAFVARAKELGAEVHVESANSDDATQIQNVTGLLSRGVDVLVIVPHNAQAMARAVELAHEQGVSVIAYDRLIRGCDLDLYLSFDNVRVGRVQAQFIVDRLPMPDGQPMKLVRIYGAKSDNNALLFKQGQDEVLQPYIDRGEIEIVQEDFADDWKPENAKRITNAALTKVGRELDAVLASNDGTAGGAIQALSEEGLAGDVIVTGQDAELVACQRIAQGTQAMTVFKPLKLLADRCAELAVDFSRGKPLVANATTNNGMTDVPTVMMDVQIVTSDNLDVVVDAGMHSSEAIRGTPEAGE